MAKTTQRPGDPSAPAHVREGASSWLSRAPSLRLPRSVTILVALATFLLVAGTLYVARAILIPIALAILITFLLTPPVIRLQRWGLPRAAAVVSVMAVAIAALGCVVGLIGSQVYDLARELPDRRAQIAENVSRITRVIVGKTEDSPAPKEQGADIGGLIEDVQEEVKQQVESTSEKSESGLGVGPIPVRIVEPEPVVPDMVTMFARQAASPVGKASLVVVLVLFMLLTREDLRNRIVTLSGRSHLAVTTKALDEAAQRIARYLLMQFVINVSYGLCVGIGLFLIGVQYAALWGLCAAILRYVPYIGPWIAASLPIGYSLLTSGHWTEPAFAIGLIIMLELVSNNFMEPWLYGRGVGVSSVAVILSAVFWGWLWGPVGLVLATPLTACLVVAGRYVPAMSWFNRFLGDSPEVEGHIVYYQRLLARDEEEAQEIFDDFARQTSLETACEKILVPALCSLKYDRARGIVTEGESAYITESIEEHLEELSLDLEPAHEENIANESALFLGYGAGDPEDEAAALIFDRLVARNSCRFEVLSREMLAAEIIERIRAEEPAALCVFSLPPGGVRHVRALCKRLLATFPELKIILAHWGSRLRDNQGRAFRELGVAYVGRTPAETREQMTSIGRLVPSNHVRPDEDPRVAGVAADNHSNVDQTG